MKWAGPEWVNARMTKTVCTICSSSEQDLANSVQDGSYHPVVRNFQENLYAFAFSWNFTPRVFRLRFI